MLKHSTAALLLVAILAIPLDAQPTYPDNVGIGVSMSWGMPFVDAAKTLRDFEAIGGGSVAKDARGWPLADAQTVLWDHRPVQAWFGDIDDPEHFIPDMTGTYTMSFVGQAAIGVVEGDFSIAGQVYNPGTNVTTCDLIVPATVNEWSNLVYLKFENTSGGISNLRVIRPGYDHDTTQIFHTPFINAVKPFASFRTLGWVESNNSNDYYPDQIEWPERKQWDDCTQYSWGNKKDGAAWETVIWLANEVGIDPWINIPVHASDDYITQLAILFKDNLDPDRVVYVEYCNEVWNWSFSQSVYNNEWAQANGLNYIKQYARRTAQISNIWKNVWDAPSINDRVRVILCWQIGWNPPDSQYIEQLEYINNHFGTPNQIIYAIGVAPYFNCQPVCESGTVDQIIDAMWASSDSSVSDRQLVKTVADNWGVHFFAYEGGSDTGGGDPANIADKIAAERHWRMGELQKHDLIDNWFNIGGEMFSLLEVCSGYSRYGSWGLTDDITNVNRNYKYPAVMEVIGWEGDIPEPTDPAVCVVGDTGCSGCEPGNPDGSIILTWTDQSNGDQQEDYFIVQRMPLHGSESWTDIATVSADTTCYCDSNSLYGLVEYSYRVGAVRE